MKASGFFSNVVIKRYLPIVSSFVLGCSLAGCQRQKNERTSGDPKSNVQSEAIVADDDSEVVDSPVKSADASKKEPRQVAKSDKPKAEIRQIKSGSDPKVLAEWKKSFNKKINLQAWGRYNPSPFRSYFKGDDKEVIKKWYVNLGPLGIVTRMRDRSWGVFPAMKSEFPASLSDGTGELVWNHFEVVQVKPDSPAEGVVHPGDLILAMDGEFIKGAQHCLIDREFDSRNVRGLEMHAGEVIDRAEGVGSIKLMVLPKAKVAGSADASAKWTELAVIKSSAGTKIDVAFPSRGAFRIVSLAGKAPGISGLIVKNLKSGVSNSLVMKRRMSSTGVTLEAPGKGWSLVGAIDWKSSKGIKIEFRPDANSLPPKLAAKVKTVNLKLAAIGSFGGTFDPNGKKAQNYSEMIKHRLLLQQSENGSWDARGYGSVKFPTSICALALMSTGDPAVMPAVEKAANYVMTSRRADKWSYINGVQLLFLAEYYLYSKDEAVLPSLRMAMTDIRRFVLSDFTSGHSYIKPGYGGSGYIGGGGAIACGLAAACNTPIATDDDKALLRKMLLRVQEIAPAGLVPYGRGGKAKAHNSVKGQSGSCGTGPYFVGSLIGGGGKVFVEAARARYSTAPFGSAENGHATQTLHFFWGMLSSLRASESSYQKAMDAYLWKFTTLREYDGLVNKNNYRVEYHNGDGVVGEPYWRTAAYLILMNTHRKELAITGNPKWQAKSEVKSPRLYNAHKSTKLAMLRNWALVDAALGESSPASLKSEMKKLQQLQEDTELGNRLLAFMKVNAPPIAKAVLSTPQKKGSAPRGMLAGWILGIYFEGRCESNIVAVIPDELKGNKKEVKQFLKLQKKSIKKLNKKGRFLEVPHRILIAPRAVMQKTNMGTSLDIGASLFPVSDLTVFVADPKKKLFHKPISAKGHKGLEAVCKLKADDGTKLKAKVSYRCAGMKIEYVVDFDVPTVVSRQYEPALEKIEVVGTMVADFYNSYSMGIRLSNGIGIACEQRNVPAQYLLAGQQYKFLISPGSIWGHDLRAAKLIGKANREISFSSPAELKDDSQSTGLVVKPNQPLEIKLNKKANLKSIYLDWDETKFNHAVEAMVDGKWILISPRGNPGLRPCSAVTTDRVRILTDTPGTLREVRFVGDDGLEPFRTSIW